MFNRGIPSFYNPKLDQQGQEEKFLLKRRMRLIDKLKALNGKTDLISHHKIRVLTRQLEQVERKLGVK